MYVCNIYVYIYIICICICKCVYIYIDTERNAVTLFWEIKQNIFGEHIR